MANDAQRLFLVAPPTIEAETFPARLAEALAAGEVAAVLLFPAGAPRELIAAELVPMIQQAGAAALVADDTRLAGRAKADGVQISAGLADLRAAIASFKPTRIVGAGGVHSRHVAMDAAEAGADYVFFGRPHGDTHDAPHPRVLELAEWWADVVLVPAVVMAGRAVGSVAEAAATGADFVALHDAVWAHPQGPGAAVAAATQALRRDGKAAA